MRNIAVILAGGVGKRVGGEKPKQFLMISGRMVIEYTMDAFNKHDQINEIAIVVNPDYVDLMQDIIKRNHWQKVTKVLKGGAERYLSTLAAIEAYEEDAQANMIFHDAARPLVSQQIIDRVIHALDEHEAVGVAMNVTDTIWQVDGEYIHTIPNRTIMRKAQTPQAFRLRVIKEAYRRGLNDPHMDSTDDCGMVLKYIPETKIYVVEGEERNMKLTYKEDILFLENYLSDQQNAE